MFQEANRSMADSHHHQLDTMQDIIEANAAKLSRLRDQISFLHREVTHLNASNQNLLADSTCYHANWIEADYRVKQLSETLESLNVELPDLKVNQFPGDKSLPVCGSPDDDYLAADDFEAPPTRKRTRLTGS
jgi:chromosome segregation ATPase